MGKTTTDDGVEEGGLADIWEADDTGFQAHENSGHRKPPLPLEKMKRGFSLCEWKSKSGWNEMRAAASSS